MASDPSAEMNAALHSAFMNGKYNADREAFLDFWDRAITFLVLASGATAFLDLAGEHNQRVGASALALFALAQLVFDIPANAKKHAFLKEKYFDLAAQIKTGESDPGSAESDMLRLAGQEPPPYYALHALAENWATMAVYGDDRPVPCRVPSLRRLLKNVLRQSDYSFAADGSD